MENTSLVWCKIFLMLMQNGDNNWGGDVQDCGYAKLAIPLCNAGLKIFWMSGSTDGPKTLLCGNVLWAWKHLFVSSFFEVSLYLLWQAIWLVTRYSGCSTIFRPNILSRTVGLSNYGFCLYDALMLCCVVKHCCVWYQAVTVLSDPQVDTLNTKRCLRTNIRYKIGFVGRFW